MNKTVNGIGDEGARSLSEALKLNTTLKSVSLDCLKSTRQRISMEFNNNEQTQQSMKLVEKEHVH